MNEWQPIETAPLYKLIIIGRAGVPSEVGKKKGLSAPHFYEIGEEFCDEQNPTHWMPLPEPPK